MAQAACASAFAVLSARWLGPSDRGVVVLVSTLGSLFMLAGSLGTATGGRMLLSRADPRFGLDRSRRFAVRLTALQLLSTAALGCPLLWAIAGWHGWAVSACFVMYGGALVGIYLLREALHGIGQHLVAVNADLLMAGLLVIGALVMNGLGLFTLTTAVALLSVTAAAELSFLLLVSKREAGKRPTPTNSISWSSLVRLSLPAAVASFAQAFVIRGDRLLLGAMSDTTSVGLYGTAATFGEAAWLISLALSQVAFRESGQRHHAKVRQLRRYCQVGTLGTIVVGALLARPVVDLLLGPAYAAAVPLIWYLLGAAGLMSMYLFDAAVLNGSGRLTEPATASMVGAVILAAGCLILIPHFGAPGAAIASIAAYGVMALLAGIWARRMAPCR